MSQQLPQPVTPPAMADRRTARRGPALGAALSALLALGLVLGALLLTRAPGDGDSGAAPAGGRAAQGTVSPTLAVSVTAAVTPTLAISGTPTAIVSATVTVGLTPTTPPEASVTSAPRPSPTASPSGATTYVPYASRGADHALPGGRVWGVQFAWDSIPVEHRKAVALELKRPATLGVGSVRTMLRWRQIEPRNTDPSGYDWSVADELLGDYSRNYDVLVSIVDYPAWATVYKCGYDFQPGMEAEWRQFIRALAERYSRPPYRIAGWEISNEVDIKTTIDDLDRKRPEEWGGGEPTVPVGGCFGDRPEAYLRFLRSARAEIKAVSPTAVVTLGGLAYVSTVPGFHPEFLDRFLDLGGGDAIDVMNLHWFPDIPTEPSGTRKFAAVRASLAAHGKGDLPIWITETYRLTQNADPDSFRRQMRFLTGDLLEILAIPQVQRVYWYGWVDFPAAFKAQPTDPDRGLVTSAYEGKPALKVLPLAIAQTDGRGEDLSTERYALLRFQAPRAAEIHYVAWSKTGQAERVLIPARGERQARAQLFPWEAVKAPGAQLPPLVTIGADGDGHALEVGTEPIFVTVR